MVVYSLTKMAQISLRLDKDKINFIKDQLFIQVFNQNKDIFSGSSGVHSKSQTNIFVISLQLEDYINGCLCSVATLQTFS